MEYYLICFGYMVLFHRYRAACQMLNTCLICLCAFFVSLAAPQTQLFAALDKSEMSVWEALHSLDELREYEAVLMAEQAGEAQVRRRSGAAGGRQGGGGCGWWWQGGWVAGRAAASACA